MATTTVTTAPPEGATEVKVVAKRRKKPTPMDRFRNWASVSYKKTKVVAKKAKSRLGRIGRRLGRGLKRGGLALWSGAKIAGRWVRTKAVGARQVAGRVAYRATGYLGSGGAFVVSSALILLAVVALGITFIGDGVGRAGDKATSGLVKTESKFNDTVGAGAARMARGESVKAPSSKKTVSVEVPTATTGTGSAAVLIYDQQKLAAEELDAMISANDTTAIDAITDANAVKRVWAGMGKAFEKLGDDEKKSYYWGREYAVGEYLLHPENLLSTKTQTYVANAMKVFTVNVEATGIVPVREPWKKGLQAEVNRLKTAYAAGDGSRTQA